MEKARKTIFETPKKTITQYVSVTFIKSQVVDNNMDSYEHDGVRFNKYHTYSSLGFCSTNDAYKLIDKLDFKTFNEVLNFISKKWGWKILNISPIVSCKVNSSYSSPTYTETYTSAFLYTFYREVEVDK